VRRSGWLAAAGAAALFALGLIRVSGFFTDDSYIHLVFARNLARGLGWCFNPGEPVYGFTSPLWVLCLAAGHALVADWVQLARLLGLGFTLLAVGATYRLARAAGGTVVAGLLAAGALALHAWFLRWSLSGMETSLAAFLVAMGLERLLRGGRCVGGGLAMLALAALARPEALLLFGLAAAWAGVRACRGSEPPAPAVIGTVVGAGLLLAWELWAHAATGAWLPSTFGVKRAHEALALGAVVRPTVHFLEVVGSTDVLLAGAALAALVALARRRAVDHRLALLAAWPALLAALYLLTRFQMISRYWVPALPALAAAAAVGAQRAFGPRARGALAAAYVAQQAALVALLVLPRMSEFTSGLRSGPAEMGRWIAAHAAPDAVVATPDIGALGFYSERRILDLGGLITPAMAPLLAEHDLSEVVARGWFERAGHADYLVDRAESPDPLPGGHYRLLRVSRIGNLGLSRPGPRYYLLYRVLPGPQAGEAR
jgi:hypothetical protein